MQNDYEVVNNGAKPWEAQELLMRNSSVTLPTNAPIGSCAHTADMSYMAIFDGTDWNQVGGSN